MNNNENAQSKKIAKSYGLVENQDGKYRDGSNTLSYSKTGASGTFNGSFFNTVAELKSKLKNK